MFLLCFASADPDGKNRLALAQDILRIPSTEHQFSSRLAKLVRNRGKVVS